MTENYNISLVECQAGNRGIEATIMARLSWFTTCVGSLKKKEEIERVRRFRKNTFFGRKWRTCWCNFLLPGNDSRSLQTAATSRICCAVIISHNSSESKTIFGIFLSSRLIEHKGIYTLQRVLASPRQKKNWFPPSLSSILTRYDCIRERKRVCEPQHLWRL